MKKRIVSMLLAIAMLLGICPVVSLASNEVKESLLTVNYGSGLTVDGELDELQWLTNGKLTGETASRRFGALWDSDHLYIAVIPQSGDETLTLDFGKTLTVNIADLSLSGELAAAAVVQKWDAVEIRIPFAALDFTPAYYGQLLETQITLDVLSWSGNLSFSAAEHSFIPTFGLGGVEGSAANVTNTTDGVSYTISNRYQEGKANTNNNTRGYRIQLGVPPLSRTDLTAVLEFDFHVAAMPAMEFEETGRAYVTYGFAASMINAKYEGASFGITNTPDGLMFVLGSDVEGSEGQQVLMNRVVGDTFHMRLEYTPDNMLSVYVDEELLGTYLHRGVDPSMGGGGNTCLFFDMWSGSINHPTQDGANDTEFTFSNVRVGTKAGDSVLDALTFADICGDNATADAVSGDLVLPSVFSDGKLKNVKLVWFSSDESAITAEGKVLPSDEAKQVTLTAALEADPTQKKSFYVTVIKRALEAYIPIADIAVDGVMNELSWTQATRQTMQVCSGASGAATALWSKGTMWIGLTYENADTAVITLGQNSWSVPLSENIATGPVTGIAKNGVAELKIDMKAAGIVLTDYNDSVDYQIALSGEGTASLQANPVSLAFSGKQVTVRDLGESWLANSSYADGVLTMTSTGGETYWIQQQVPGLDHNFDLYQEMTVRVENMPEGGGTFHGSVNARGFYFWIADLTHFIGSGTAGDLTEAVIYNAGGGALKIRVKTANGYTEMDLGKNLGDTFRIGYLWSAKDTATVYVDGKNIGTATDVTFYAEGGGNDLLTYRIWSPVSGQTATAYVEDMTFTTVKYSTVQTELTQQLLLGDQDFSTLHDGDWLVLPGSWDTSLGTVNLEWSSDSDAIVLTKEADGSFTCQVNGAEDQYHMVKLTVSMAGKELWSVDATVEPGNALEYASAKLVQASFTADTITLDGSTKDETWILASRLVTSNGELKGEFGVQWDAENLYLLLDARGTATSVTVNQVDLAAKGQAVSARSVTEYKIPLSELGITVNAYDITVPIHVAVDDQEFVGTLKLVSTDWWATGNRQSAMPILEGYNNTVAEGVDVGTPTENQGTQKTPNGWRMFDLYDAGGKNPEKIRSYVIFMKMPIYDNMDDASTALYAEFDFRADKLPVYDFKQARDTKLSYYSNAGVNFSLARKEDSAKNADTLMFGIYNSKNGLVFVSDGSVVDTVELGKKLGDQFRVGINWIPNGDMQLYIDGVLFKTFKKAQFVGNAIGNGSFVMNLQRNSQAAESDADSMDVTITNIGLGKRYDCSAISRLGFDDIRGENTKAAAIIFDLVLTEKILGQLEMFDEEITWSSSAPEVVDPVTGKVTRPATGMARVVLTAALEDGSKKDFVLIVRGLAVDNEGVLVLANDTDPARGAGAATDEELFVLDTNHSSVICDLGVVQTVNVVRLRDLDEFSRLNRESLTLWVSDDNAVYTEVEDYKLLHSGRDWYLYDFSAKGQYIKAHYTHFDGTESDFIGVPGEMIDAYSQAVFGSGEGTFSTAVQTVTNTTGVDRKDSAWTLEMEGDASVRVLLNGNYLYHYVEDGKITVRVPFLAADESVELTVFYGAADALDISNKEAVYEVTYGTRETYKATKGRWLHTFAAGTVLANGETVEREYLLGFSAPYAHISYDGGVTWDEMYTMDSEVSKEIVGDSGGGFIFDPNTGLLYFQSQELTSYGDMETARSIKKIFVSDDGGKTWNLQYVLQPDTVEGVTYNYILSYSDGIVLDGYDGDGPAVDMLFPTAAQFNDHVSFCNRVAYTVDGGKTWQYSKSLMVFGDPSTFEGGVSESTILQREDGVLVCYSRCQFSYTMNFAKFYSDDNGVTWYSDADPDPADHLVFGEVSTVYTCNTQPVLYRYDDAPMFFWGGNSVFGGTSNMRNPLSVAVSYDGLETFRNIQNLHSKTFLDEYMYDTSVTNPSVRKFGEDDLAIVYTRLFTYQDNIYMIVRDFSQWFYGTKGIYDSFEHGTVQYEGWVSDNKPAAGEVDDTYASHGAYSMRLDTGIAFRSVPYVQDGKLSLDFYAAEGSSFEMQLQPALDVSMEKLPLIVLSVDGLSLTVAGEQIALQAGWNTVVVDLALTDGKAAVSANGSEQIMLTPDVARFGDYVTYLLIKTSGTVYVDNILLVDDEDAEIPEAKPEIVENSISLKGTVDVNVYVEMGNRVASDDNAYMLFTMANGDEVKVPVSEAEKKTENGKTLYLFRCDVPAKEMTDTVKAQFFYGDGESTQEKIYSVKGYGDYILDDETGTYSAELKNLVTHMLHYGAAAQKHFLHKTDDLANDGLDPISLDGVTAETLKGHVAKSGSSELVTFYGNSLILKGETTLRFFFQVAEGTKFTVTHNGKALDITQRGELYYVSVENIAAKDLDTDVTLTVSVGKDEFSVTANALTYAYNVLSQAENDPASQSEDLVNLVKTIALYNQAANDYFAQ